MKPNKIILLNITIGLLIPMVIYKFYKKFDKQYYRCSDKAHLFGILFPATNIVLISLLLNKNYDNCSINNGLKIVLLIFSYSMFYFNLIYHLDKEGIIKI